VLVRYLRNLDMWSTLREIISFYVDSSRRTRIRRDICLLFSTRFPLTFSTGERNGVKGQIPIGNTSAYFSTWSIEKSFLDQAGEDMTYGDVNFLNSWSLLGRDYQ